MRASLGQAAVAGLLLTLSVGGCGRSVDDKIHGWPPPAPPAARVVDTLSPPADTASQPPQPDASVAGRDGGAESEGDTLVLPEEPCHALIVLACDFFGEFTDDCGEARTRVPDGADPATRAACQALVTRFVGPEQATRISPCRRYARELCRAEGYDSRACRRARDNVSRLPGRKSRVCYGDLLMWEARELRR